MVSIFSSDRDHRRFLPDNYSLSDVFVVSFPKSGNTWLRFLIANAIKIKYKVERDVNFFSIHDILPDVHISSKIVSQGPFGIRELPRIIKSHTEFNPYYSRVILLVRDPKDVVISFYHYLKNYKKIPADITMSEFIRDKKYGAPAWVEHTGSWLRSYKAGYIVRVFRYEDLKDNTAKELGEIMNLIGISLTSDELTKAVELSSINVMKRSENTHMSTYLLKHQKTAFVRNAKVTRGNELTSEDKHYVEDLAKEILLELSI